jgi:NitT/TauT family transport system permease protein
MKKLYNLLGFAILLIVWIILLTIGLLDSQFVPWPQEICKRLFSLFCERSFYVEIFSTLLRMSIGFILAFVIGDSIGLLVGYYHSLSRIIESPVDFLRSVPATAMIPLFLFLLGIGNASKIGVVVFACGLINILNAMYGVQSVSYPLLMMATAFSVRRSTILYKIIIPSALPQIIAGLRTTLSLSLVLVVVAEMLIGTGIGIGQRIIDAQLTYRISEMYALIFSLGLIGFLLNRGFVMCEKRLLHWVRNSKLKEPLK